MQIYLYNSDDFDSLAAAIKERRIISAMAVFFEVGGSERDNVSVPDPGVGQAETLQFVQMFVSKS